MPDSLSIIEKRIRHREYCKSWRRNHPEYKRNQRECMRKWRRNHPEENKRHQEKTRKAILEILGSKCSNVDCPIPFDKMDVRALHIDHVNGGGHKHQKRKGVGSMWVEILRELRNGSKDYQLLCAYCNWMKRYENGELKRK